MKSLHGHNHLCVVIADAGRGERLVHLILVDGEPVWLLLKYFQERSLDLSTEKSYAYAAGLLIDFVAARADDFIDISKRGDLFTAFASAVFYGTIKDGCDPSGLWWQPRSTARARKLIKHVCEISDWLHDEYKTTAINSFTRTAPVSEQIVFWRRWNSQKAGSLLAHLKSRRSAHGRSMKSRTVALPGTMSTVMDKPPAFPEEYIETLLFEGFILAGGKKQSLAWRRWNLRDILITLLMHYGGLRVSEPFHLWVDDVFIDPSNPKKALVLIHHPHDGMHEHPDPITGRQVLNNRASILKMIYNREPLTEMTGKKHSGWKDSLLTNSERKAFEVFWFPQSAGELFLTLYRLYLQHVRPATSRHPYLFVTEDGEPMGALGFAKNHDRAVLRIGLNPSKAAGTSCHGHRHAFGQRLERAGISEKVIQVAMHHVSPLSQKVYTMPDLDDVQNALSEAMPNLPVGHMPFELPIALTRR